MSKSESRSVVTNSLQPCGLYSPWNSSGQNTGVGNLSLLQGIFPNQGSNPGLLHWGWIRYQLSHKERPECQRKNLTELEGEQWLARDGYRDWMIKLGFSTFWEVEEPILFVRRLVPTCLIVMLFLWVFKRIRGCLHMMNWQMYGLFKCIACC